MRKNSVYPIFSSTRKAKIKNAIHAREDIEHKEHVSIVGGSANMCSHFWKQYSVFFRNLEIDLPQDPASLLLGI